MEEVLAGITCNGEFREDDEFHATAVGYGYLFLDGEDVIMSVCHFHSWNSGCDCCKSVFHFFFYYLIVTCVAP